MNTILRTAALAAIILTGCDNAVSTQEGARNAVSDPITLRRESILTEHQTIVDSVAEGLQFMREEEKLARDVYQVFAARYGSRVFANIARSEQQHMDAIGVLLERYGIEDPVGAAAPGVFRNPALQALYTALIAQGSVSLTEGLAVGKAIEEIDIRDLDEHLKEVPADSDIAAVYGNLRSGSENHLRAFSR